MFKNLILLFVFIILSTQIKASEELKFESILFNRDTVEISGLTSYRNSLLMVGDKLSNRAVYKIKFEKNRFYYNSHIDLTKLSGHNKYFAKALLLKHGERLIKSPFDLEGITYCNDTFYIVNEQVRHILKVTSSKVENLPIDFSPIFQKFKFPLKKVATNAGFEGITADCKRNKLYIAQERSPRAIIQVDLKTNTVEDMFLISNKETKDGSEDFADLHFEDDHLYLLKRNSHEITKYSLKDRKEVKTVKFGNTNKIHLREIYNTGEPYGLAEGMAITKDTIYLGIDNNRNKISEKAQKAFDVSGRYSSIIIYTRPEGF